MKGAIAVAALVIVNAGVGVVFRGSGLPLKGGPVVFALTERSGAPFASTALLGRDWISGFVFTYCAGPCPLITTRMAEMQHKLPAAIALATFTVDPERDTPEKLRTYADAYGAEAGRWYFLTGSTADVGRVLGEGFLIGATKEPGTATEYQVTHSTMVVLVDRSGRIRDYYNFKYDEEVERLEADARRLHAAGE